MGIVLISVCLLAAAVLAALYLAVIYLRLLSLKQDVTEAWSNIDILLRQRHDELPKLVEVCKRYLPHQGDTLHQVMLARSGVAEALNRRDLEALGLAESNLRRCLAKLLTAAESSPLLKGDESFRRLEPRITNLDSGIADRRKSYNDRAHRINRRLARFPDLVVAQLFLFKPFELLRIQMSR